MGTPPRRLARLLAAALAAALGASCGSAPAPAPPPSPPPPAAVTDAAPVDDESRAILLLMADRRLYDPTAAELMLGGPPGIRRELAVTLGRIGDRRGRSLLQGLLVDDDADVRRAAAFALGELGDRAAERALIAAAVDDDAELGRLAVEALGKLGVPLAEVRRALSAIAPETGWRRLAPALFRFEEPATVEVAELGLVGEPAVRAGCAYALSRLARPESARALRGLLTDREAAVRAWAARGVGEVGGAEDLARLEPLLADGELSPVLQALQAAGRILERVSAVPPLGWAELVRAAIDDARPGVRTVALEVAVRFLPHPPLEEALRAVWLDGEQRERGLALGALVSGRVDGADELAREAALEPDAALRAAAVRAAAALGAADLVEALAIDPEPRVRVAALEALAVVAAAPAAARFLDDPDVTVRATALDLLAQHPELPARRLAAALDATQGDAMNDARLAGVRALAGRGRSVGGERAEVVEALTRLASDRDWLVRREAADALAGLGEPRPPVGALEPGRDLAFYRQALAQTAAPRRVRIDTDRGGIELELACPDAPLTCLSFLQLAAQGYFDGLRFHRVVPDFVVQAGDPRGDGWGGPGYALRDEINRRRYERGVVGMALSGPDTGGSQFFVTLSPQPRLDGGYTVFGRVTGGSELLDRIRQGDRILRVRETSAKRDGR